MNLLPPIVLRMTHSYDGWIVGGGAKPGIDVQTLRDWDVLVPFCEWHKAALDISGMVKSNAVRMNVNSFGGYKLYDGDTVIDVWPQDLSLFLTYGPVTHIWQPKFGLRYSKSHT